MADIESYNNHPVTEVSQMPSPSAASSCIPLRLCGFLSGDTVQVQGDTGELQFSVQFNVHKKEHNSGEPISFPHSLDGAFRDSVQSSPSSSYLTPTASFETQPNADANAVGEESWPRSEVMTRLRSGVLSPVKYYHDGRYRLSLGNLNSTKKKKKNKGRGEGHNMFEKMLKRRSFPLRPCNSYAFFLMANWGVVKRSSFGETSRRLSKKWYKLPQDMKKEFENMASKDNARYKRQCILLRNDAEEEIASGLPADSE